MIPFPNKKYSVIYADPPWAYRTYSKKGQGRSAESHYPTMCIEDIKALPVGNLAATSQKRQTSPIIARSF